MPVHQESGVARIVAKQLLKTLEIAICSLGIEWLAGPLSAVLMAYVHCQRSQQSLKGTQPLCQTTRETVVTLSGYVRRTMTFYGT